MSTDNSTASPCKKCGALDFYSNGRCRPCQKKSCSNWYEKHKDKKKESSKLWRAENPDKAKEYLLAWAKNNPEKFKEKREKYSKTHRLQTYIRKSAYRQSNPEKSRGYTSKWRLKNPEYIRLQNHARRARTRMAFGSLSIGLSARLFKLQRGMCPCCGRPLGKKYHLDHIMPLALGGSNTDDNMQLLRSICNMQKHKKNPSDFMRSRGFLL